MFNLSCHLSTCEASCWSCLETPWQAPGRTLVAPTTWRLGWWGAGVGLDPRKSEEKMMNWSVRKEEMWETVFERQKQLKPDKLRWNYGMMMWVKNEDSGNWKMNMVVGGWGGNVPNQLLLDQHKPAGFTRTEVPFQTLGNHWVRIRSRSMSRCLIATCSTSIAGGEIMPKGSFGACCS